MMWQTQTTIEYPFALRPASIEEAGLFYSQMDEAEDAVLGTVGHIRMDFGASGKEFYHTWWPHNGDQFNTGEFKDELQKFVDMLRSDGPLTNLASMRNYCYQHGGIRLLCWTSEIPLGQMVTTYSISSTSIWTSTKPIPTTWLQRQKRRSIPRSWPRH